MFRLLWIVVLAVCLTAAIPSGFANEVGEVPDSIRQQYDIEDNGFYQKYLDAAGLPILSSPNVDDRALIEVRQIVLGMLRGRDDILARMSAKKIRIGIMACTEFTTDMPETRDMNPGWSKRARGLGGNPVTCDEENVLQFRGDPYEGESIFLHEFSHAIMLGNKIL